jgi:sucrose-6-phosphate hydrolase SacC (GH32 family)
VAFYTSYGCGQRIAYSNDEGRTWEKYTGNPIIAFDQKDDARDPKVFWHQPSGKWVMVLWRKPDGEARKQGFSIYNSTDLIHWEYKSHVAGFFECPDLVELMVNNHPDETRWVLFEGDGSYIVGMFDGANFIPESAKMKSDFGANFYATQTWNNIPASDGRVIQIAWMKDGEYPEMPFKGQMTFPCELSLRDNGFGKRLVKTPVKEIEVLQGKGEHWTNRNVIPGINDNVLKKFRGECFRIVGTFDLKTSDNFGFLVRHSKKIPGTEILYNVKRGVLSCLGRQVPLPPVDGKIQIEILLDRSSIEIFANKGLVAMSSCLFAPENSLDLELFTIGGELMVEKLDVYELKSAWREKE